MRLTLFLKKVLNLLDNEMERLRFAATLSSHTMGRIWIFSCFSSGSFAPLQLHLNGMKSVNSCQVLGPSDCLNWEDTGIHSCWCCVGFRCKFGKIQCQLYANRCSTPSVGLLEAWDSLGFHQDLPDSCFRAEKTESLAP